MKRLKSFLFVGLASLCAATLLGGCSTILLFNPKGPIGEAERFVILAAIGLMMIVLIPVFIMAFWFPRTYRASNTKAKYMPKWSHSAGIEFFMWAVPIAIVVVLAVLAATKTHSLDPFKPIPSSEQPINIQAVCLDWKWLFIYPDQNIAAVNRIVFPVNVPVSFKITSDTVMASFFIPQLGSQIYAMAGMQSRLHLLANQPGIYAGHNQQFTGRGYADMHFEAKAVSMEEFQAWIKEVGQSAEKLDLERYEKLTEPNDGYYPVTYFSLAQPDLFEYILQKYVPNHGRHSGQTSGSSFPVIARPNILEEN